MIPLKLNVKWKEKDSLRNQLVQSCKSEQVIPTVFGNAVGLAACAVQCLAMQLHREKNEGCSPRSCGKRCTKVSEQRLLRYISTMALRNSSIELHIIHNMQQRVVQTKVVM